MSMSCPFGANRHVTLISMNVPDLLSAVDSELATLKQVRALLTDDGHFVRRATGPAKKHIMSAAARKRIGDAQKRRWAAWKMGKQSQSHLKKLKATPAKKKRTMSAEGRARIVAALKARWAKQKKAVKKSA
jgi:hypothetical protein